MHSEEVLTLANICWSIFGDGGREDDDVEGAVQVKYHYLDGCHPS